MVWDVNKRTPAMMYDRLNVVKATSQADKSYHIYINYLSFYEFIMVQRTILFTFMGQSSKLTKKLSI
ncbi:hypothetical protein F442_23195 [Phytophthora nicotianae P10297]|uniref:Uncharacterized protein n=1 Tax=Phytophthora nicotianae P10297 TaxID=1317064 RepID=W2XXF9_PHYNI|nr:hypothetical protein F442_23195 [Phytophthora nicotianae P10297]